ncbi:MAG: EamA family transporter [Thermoplasmata archaeon]|nr:EamA family transporter [Thermoplasmata archaeon]
MWMVYAVLSAVFAALTSIFAKVGIRNVDSNLATALRTIVVLIMAWAVVLVVGSADGIGDISGRTLLFLVLSGLATGASWLCYFKAIQLGDVNKVAPVDKSSTILAVILAFLLLGEHFSAWSAVGMLLMFAGTMLMIERKDVDGTKDVRGSWLIYAILSAVFAALTSILGKVGIEDVESNLGTAIRTAVVLVMAWMIVFMQGTQGQVRDIGRRDGAFLVLSGLATGASWLCFYRALQEGPASLVVPIDKLSILFTVVFAFVFLHERMSVRSWAGLALLVVGTLAMLLRCVRLLPRLFTRARVGIRTPRPTGVRGPAAFVSRRAGDR